jgi:anti-sigma28 factor (negative regulator of flagellin synthesis)
MATSTVLERPELQSTGLCQTRDEANDLGRGPLPSEDVAMERIQETLNATPWEEVVRRVGSLLGVRRGKVLSIRRQIAQGTYSVDDRLERAADRVLEEVSG